MRFESRPDLVFQYVCIRDFFPEKNGTFVLSFVCSSFVGSKPHLGSVVQSSFRGTSLFFRPNAVCSKVGGFVATLRIFLVL